MKTTRTFEIPEDLTLTNGRKARTLADSAELIGAVGAVIVVLVIAVLLGGCQSADDSIDQLDQIDGTDPVVTRGEELRSSVGTGASIARAMRWPAWSAAIRDIGRGPTIGSAFWTFQKQGTGGPSSIANAVAVDPASGAVVVVGTMANSGSSDIWIAKLDAAGRQVWSHEDHPDVPASPNEALAVAIGSNGAIGVAGVEWAFVAGAVNPRRRLFVRKLAADGSELWRRNYGGAPGIAAAEGACFDPVGNLVVAGWEMVSGDGANVFARKYDAAGTELWTHTFAGDAHLDDRALAVACSADGDFVMAGYEGITGGHTPWLRRLSSGGALMWTSVDAPRAGIDAAIADVKFDGVDLVTVGQERVIDVGGEDALSVRRYDGRGALRWDAREDISEYDLGFGVAPDGRGGMIVTAEVLENAAPWVRAYAADGSVRWTRTGSATPSRGKGRAIALTRDGGAVIAGALEGAAIVEKLRY